MLLSCNSFSMRKSHNFHLLLLSYLNMVALSVICSVICSPSLSCSFHTQPNSLITFTNHHFLPEGNKFNNLLSPFLSDMMSNVAIISRMQITVSATLSVIHLSIWNTHHGGLLRVKPESILQNQQHKKENWGGQAFLFCIAAV